ncbi:MAG: hypothetical protein JST89_15925 [Cyanobacteria bacterium SZAS-4]|nr:hypothetical protein [Cyanobacteria bacterium SZAS-4]
MPEDLDDDISFAETSKQVAPNLLTPSEEQEQITLRVEPSSDKVLLPEISAAPSTESSAKVEIGYSINQIDYSRKGAIRTAWNYFYIFLLIPILLILCWIGSTIKLISSVK